MDRASLRKTLLDLATLLGALALLASGALALRRAMDRFDPRGAALRAVRAEADPHHDLLFVPFENAELVQAAWPLPVVRGLPPLGSLGPFRRVYALGTTDGHFVPLSARFGPAGARPAEGARRWDLDGLRSVVLDLGDGLTTRVSARREGGPMTGPCLPVGTELRCASRDPWNHLRVEPHQVDGATVQCVLAHPQNGSALIFTVDAAPAARFLVGLTAVDDLALFPEGRPVRTAIHVEPAGARPIDRVVDAPNARGGQAFRIALDGRASRVTFTVTTANAASRTHCITARWTN